MSLSSLTRTLAAASLVGGALIGATACLSVPTAAPTECTTDSDCDHADGEACVMGVCYGDPPSGAFAATIGAPSTGSDLIAVELPQFTLAQDGDLGDLALDTPVTLSGRIETPDRTSVDATITISRPSLFNGGPGFHTVVSSASDVVGTSFSVQLPRTRPGDPPYTILVVPNGRGDTPSMSPTDAESAPPFYTTLAVPGDTLIPTISLGGALPVISGTVVDANGTPLQHYRVVAVGRWDPAAALSEVSTVYYTDSDGTYSIELAANLQPGVKLVAQPYDTVAPTLELSGFQAVTSQQDLAQPVEYDAPVNLTIPVEGVEGGGQVSPVVGAHVTVRGSSSTSQLGLTETATLVAEDITDSDGTAHVSVLPTGALGSSYTLQIVPPASSSLGAVYNEALTATASGVLPVHRLDPRIAIRGVVVDTAGNPLSNVAVTVQPSLRFLWNLADDAQAFVTAIPPPTTITPATGDFVLWVDPIIDGVWGFYDLSFQPAAGSNTPAWTVSDLAIPQQSGQADLAVGNVTIPDPAFMHGRIIDATGQPVPGGQLRIFELQSDGGLCMTALNPPTSNCVVPAIVRGSGTAGSDGTTALSLPRP